MKARKLDLFGHVLKTTRCSEKADMIRFAELRRLHRLKKVQVTQSTQ